MRKNTEVLLIIKRSKEKTKTNNMQYRARSIRYCHLSVEFCRHKAAPVLQKDFLRYKHFEMCDLRSKFQRLHAYKIIETIDRTLDRSDTYEEKKIIAKKLAVKRDERFL